MNFYRDFCLERLKSLEESLVATAEHITVDDDSEIGLHEAIAEISKLSASAELVKSLLITKAAAEVYKIGQTYQIIDAADRADLVGEGDGMAEVVADAAGEEIVNYSPAPLGMGHGYSHPICPRIIGRVPIRHIHRLGPPGLFNGCLFRGRDASFFSCRTKGFPSKTYLYRPDQDMLFADPKELIIPGTEDCPSAEDVRIFEHEEDTLISFTAAGQTSNGWLCRMLVGKINADRQLEWIHPLESPLGAPVEKNWVFFSLNGNLFCVYYPSPHIVYRVDMSGGVPKLGERIEASNWKDAEFMENARGGASPIRVGDEFYHWYHTQHRWGRGTTYQVGLYTFAAAPPFDLRRVIKGPVLSMVPSKRDLDCVFPTGADLRNGRWTLSCGVQDHETFAILLDSDDIEKILEPVIKE